MEFSQTYSLFIDAITSRSLPEFLQYLKRMKCLDDDKTRINCLSTLCSLSAERGLYAFVKEIIADEIFAPPHDQLLLSVSPTLVYNAVRASPSLEGISPILNILTSTLKLPQQQIVNHLNTDGFSSLHLSAMSGDKESAKIILTLGADCRKQSSSGNTALSLAIAFNHDLLVPLFIHRSDVNNQDNDSDTPLMFAAWNNQPQVLSSLIEHGADVNAVSQNGSTALWNAVYQSSPECVLMLLRHNARTDVVCEGTHLFKSNNDNDDEKVTKIYPGQYPTLLWVAVERLGANNHSLKVLLILLEAGYNMTKDNWLKEDLHNLHGENTPLSINVNHSLWSLLVFFYSRPLSLKDLCRNSLKNHFLRVHYPYSTGIEKLRIPDALKHFLKMSYIDIES